MGLLVTRVISVSEYPWLDEDIPVGTMLTEFRKYTYGCVSPSGIAVSLDGEYPFFEVPRDAVEVTP